MNSPAVTAELHAGPVDFVPDYCASCGRRAPDGEMDPSPRLAELGRLGWFAWPSRSLRGRTGIELRNCLCPQCLASPTPFTHALLFAWEVPPAALARAAG